MNDTPAQVALRELRTRFTSPLVLGVLAALTAVNAVSGPFHTATLMTFPERLAYWAFVTPTTYAAGLLGSAFVQEAMRATPLPYGARTLLHSLGSTLLVSIALHAFHLAFALPQPVGWEVASSLGAVWVICLAIEVIGDLAERHQPQTVETAQPVAPPILLRLPLEKRGALICISAGDHYIEVTTTKGTQLILLRLSDAMAEAAPTPGLQIHRSHWVALDQVVAAARVGEGGSLTLTGGRELPIARSRMATAVAAGLFPKTG